MIVNDILFMFMVVSLFLGLGGWMIHLYTLILSYFSDKKWTIRVEFNCYHEAIPELIIFSIIIIFIIFSIIGLWR